MLEVYYDGWCPLCSGARERLERLDWLSTLRFVSLREPGACLPGISSERLEQRMHVRDTRTGSISEGVWAMAAVAKRVPALMPFWPLLVLAGSSGVGQSAYDWIARQRSIIPGGFCDSDHCTIHRSGEP